MDHAPGTVFLFPPFVESALFGPHLAAGLLSGILRKAGLRAETFDANIRLIHHLFAADTAPRVAAATRQRLGGTLESREEAGLAWYERSAKGGWYAAHPATVRYVLRTIRRALFPIPRSLDDPLALEDRPGLGLTLYQTLVDEVLDRRPDVVGISVAFAEQLTEAIIFARLVRGSRPQIVLHLGGSQINLLQPSQLDTLAALNLFDAILVPNGEPEIVRLVATAARCEETVVHRGRALRHDDLNALPTPSFDELSLYCRPLTIPVLVTKGCYWGQCSFCDYVQLSDIGGKRYLARPAVEVFAELRHAQDERGAERILLVSDAVPPGWYSKLAELAGSERRPLQTTSYMMHHAQLDAAFFDTLANAGVAAINFGTESTNERLLRLMKKAARPAAIFANFADAHMRGIETTANVIIDYPTATFSEALAVAEDFERLAPCIDTLNPSTFDLTAGTDAARSPALHAMTVSETAYIRSDHGYHSLAYARDGAMTAEQRQVLRLIFKQLAASIRLRQRLATTGETEGRDETKVELDRGALLVRSGTPHLKIPAIDGRVDLDAAETMLLADLLGADERGVTFANLRDSARAYGVTDPASWPHRLWRAGLMQPSRSNTPGAAVAQAVAV